MIPDFSWSFLLILLITNHNKRDGKMVESTGGLMLLTDMYLTPVIGKEQYCFELLKVRDVPHIVK